MATVLIADDETNLRKVLKTLLERNGHKAIAVPNGIEALNTLKQGHIDILITDLRMPGMDGLELLQAVKVFDPGLPVIVITAHGSVDTAVSALKNGAFDYITKPFDKDELKLAVQKAAAARTTGRNRLHDTGDAKGRFQIIGQSPRMHELYTMIEKVAATPSTVLITGESGTGKELVASALHENSLRKGKSFIKVNCAAIPKDLLESEFFGYEQGAFTGAVSSKPGRFELADGGTLFLDEIAEISNEMQVKLLRALQEGEFERVGGVRTIRVDIRLVAATNRDLAKEIEQNNFREDLYYRLNVVPIALPPLRDRREDIPLLVTAFLEKYNKRLGKHFTRITPEALDILGAYHWPGNIRELENVIERTLLFADGTVIEAVDLPEHLRQIKESRDGGTTGPMAPNQNQLGASVFPVARSTSQPDAQRIPLDTGSASMKDIVRQATSELEKDLILQALEETSGNVTRAAHLLQISRKGLQNKMKELGLREGTDDK